MRVRIILTLDASVIVPYFLLQPDCLVIVVVHWAILYNIYALDPASDMMAPRQVFEVGNGSCL